MVCHGEVNRKKLQEIQITHTYLRKIRTFFRTIFSIPDYEQYLDYWEAGAFPTHQEPLSPKKFYTQFLEERYGTGKTTRCC